MIFLWERPYDTIDEGTFLYTFATQLRRGESSFRLLHISASSHPSRKPDLACLTSNPVEVLEKAWRGIVHRDAPGKRGSHPAP